MVLLVSFTMWFIKSFYKSTSVKQQLVFWTQARLLAGGFKGAELRNVCLDKLGACVCVCVCVTLCTNSSILSMAWCACSSGVIPMKPSSLPLSSSSSFPSPSRPRLSSSFCLVSWSHSGTLWRGKETDTPSEDRLFYDPVFASSPWNWIDFYS